MHLSGSRSCCWNLPGIVGWTGAVAAAGFGAGSAVAGGMPAAVDTPNGLVETGVDLLGLSRCLVDP